MEHNTSKIVCYDDDRRSQMSNYYLIIFLNKSVRKTEKKRTQDSMMKSLKDVPDEVDEGT